MGEVSTIGLDLAKRVFQVQGIDAAGRVLVRRQLRRREVLACFREAARRPEEPCCGEIRNTPCAT